MVMNVTNVLLLISLILTVVSGITGKVPLWIPLMLVCVALLVPGR